MQREPTLTGTHDCFDDALAFFELICCNDADRIVALDGTGQYTIAHGICRAHASGVLFAHAWIEDHVRGWAWQAGADDAGEHVYFALPIETMVRIWDVQRFTRYTLREVMEWVTRTEHAGPWDPDYHALCDDSGRLLGAVSGMAPVAMLRRR